MNLAGIRIRIWRRFNLVAYNFQERFAEDIAKGNKTQTIRSDRKNGHVQPGQKLQLYTGQRTPDCRKLTDEDPTCLFLVNIRVESDRFFENRFCYDTLRDLDELAKLDGFGNYAEMTAWFDKQHGLPFKGWLIKWGWPECQE